MKLLGLSDAGRAFLVDAARHAAHELGLFAALDDEPREVAALAARVAAAPGRLAALLDVLAATGAARRVDGRFARGTIPPRPPAPPREGWGRLAAILRADRPAALGAEDEARHHAHLAAAGAETAREVAARLPAGSLVDLGAGAGTYARAYLERHPAARATLVDDARILALAGALPPRAAAAPGDLLAIALPPHDVALLANVLHLYPADRCPELVRRAAAAVAPGGLVAIVEVALADDRSGPLDALLFALDMAVYTGGTVHPPRALAAFLAGAGLTAPVTTALADGMVLVTARKTG